MDDYFSKPVNPQTLSDILEKWLVKQNFSQHEKTTFRAIET
jgi:YesN/AraC family two-component response regulator